MASRSLCSAHSMHCSNVDGCDVMVSKDVTPSGACGSVPSRAENLIKHLGMETGGGPGLRR